MFQVKRVLTHDCSCFIMARATRRRRQVNRSDATGGDVKKILVVDDQPTIRQLLRITLETADREVLLAESGEHALEIARRTSPDLVIMDIMMPGGMDGFETIRSLRADVLLKKCPVLVLTAKDQKAERSRAEEMQVAGFLSKPFHLDELQAQVDRLIV